jgi:hypothetical protein
MRLVIVLALLSCLSFPTALAINSYRFGYGLKDAFWRTLVSPVEGTIWAPQFDESKFSKIRFGMRAPDVVRLIGEPLHKYCGKEDCFWLYTTLENGLPGYDQRWLVFDLAERVIEIRKSFELD